MLLQGLSEVKKWYKDGKELTNSAVMPIGENKVLSFIKKVKTKPILKKEKKRERDSF